MKQEEELQSMKVLMEQKASEHKQLEDQVANLRTQLSELNKTSQEKRKEMEHSAEMTKTQLINEKGMLEETKKSLESKLEHALTQLKEKEQQYHEEIVTSNHFPMLNW